MLWRQLLGGISVPGKTWVSMEPIIQRTHAIMCTWRNVLGRGPSRRKKHVDTVSHCDLQILIDREHAVKFKLKEGVKAYLQDLRELIL